MNRLSDSKSFAPPEHPPDQTPYDADFLLWVDRQAYLLRRGRLDELDLKHLTEELEEMAGSQRRELRSRLIVLLVHLLKCRYQPERKTPSWCKAVVTLHSPIAPVMPSACR